MISNNNNLKFKPKKLHLKFNCNYPCLRNNNNIYLPKKNLCLSLTAIYTVLSQLQMSNFRIVISFKHETFIFLLIMCRVLFLHSRSWQQICNCYYNYGCRLLKLIQIILTINHHDNDSHLLLPITTTTITTTATKITSATINTTTINTTNY